MGEVIRGILIPFLGTTLGASCVLFMKKMMNKMVQRALTGFAAGIMVSASVWSLLIPSMDYAAEMGKFAFVPAIQNFPEGAIISMPLKAEGMSKGKAFLYGVLSGVVEPIGAVLTVVASGFIIPVLPYFLSFAAGAMMYVVIEELIPEMSHGDHSNIGAVMFAVGFTLMMILDVALG